MKNKEIIDIYLPKDRPHPGIRIRKNGDNYELTKKEPHPEDETKLIEQNVVLTEEEFKMFSPFDEGCGNNRYYVVARHRDVHCCSLA